MDYSGHDEQQKLISKKRSLFNVQYQIYSNGQWFKKHIEYRQKGGQQSYDSKENILYACLVQGNAFGSVYQVQLRNNLILWGLHPLQKGVILDS
jgi:hypothetical protein